MTVTHTVRRSPEELQGEQPPPDTPGKELARAGERAFLRVAAVLVGLILMLFGVGLGVSVVLLPLGIPVGLFGLFLVFWGLFSRAFSNKG